MADGENKFTLFNNYHVQLRDLIESWNFFLLNSKKDKNYSAIDKVKVEKIGKTDTVGFVFIHKANKDFQISIRTQDGCVKSIII